MPEIMTAPRPLPRPGRRGARFGAALAMAVLAASCPTLGRAEALELGGRLQTDLRARPAAVTAGPWYARQTLPRGVSRNQNIAKMRLRAEIEHVAAVADVDFMWLGFVAPMAGFSDLTLRERIDPYRLRAQAAYLEVRDLWLPGLDLRVGQQVVNWGKGDQINPTNNLNANTFEDPLLFGQQLANNMVRLDYATGDFFSVSAVLVPVFKPALLPPSAGLAVADLRRVPIRESALRRQLLFDQNRALTVLDTATVVAGVTPEVPGPSFHNMQGALRAAFAIGSHDVALSYYVGRSDMPLPIADHTEQVLGRRCADAAGLDCIDGELRTRVTAGYPRMQVLGLNAAGELPLPGLVRADLAPLGYHVEVGAFFPEATELTLTNGALFDGLQPAGEFDYGLGGRRPTVLGATPLAKWNLGLDYTLPGGVYVNLQWVHGMIDELGAGETSIRGVPGPGECSDGDTCIVETLRPRIGDYLVVGSDIHWLRDALLTRLFVVVDLTPRAVERYSPSRRSRVRSVRHFWVRGTASAVIFPELTYNVGAGAELSVGALAKLGGDDTKFGDPAAGGTEVWCRGRYTF